MAIRTVHCLLKSISPLGQSAPIATPKHRDETSADHEERCWRERAHADAHGIAFIPPNMLKNALANAAQAKAEQIPGKGKATYTKFIKSGVQCFDPIPLDVHVDDIECERLFVPSDGKVGGSKRVWKNFPVFRSWEGVAKFTLLDDVIPADVFERHLIDAGNIIGLGCFRPQNNGYWGRFSVESFEWQNGKSAHK